MGIGLERGAEEEVEVEQDVVAAGAGEEQDVGVDEEEDVVESWFVVVAVWIGERACRWWYLVVVELVAVLLLLLLPLLLILVLLLAPAEGVEPSADAADEDDE